MQSIEHCLNNFLTYHVWLDRSATLMQHI